MSYDYKTCNGLLFIFQHQLIYFLAMVVVALMGDGQW